MRLPHRHRAIVLPCREAAPSVGLASIRRPISCLMESARASDNTPAAPPPNLLPPRPSLFCPPPAVPAEVRFVLFPMVNDDLSALRQVVENKSEMREKTS